MMDILWLILMAAYGTGFGFTLGYCLGTSNDHSVGKELTIALVVAVSWPIAWAWVACTVIGDQQS